MLRVVEREARVYRRLWRGSVFSTFLIPALFLLAIGRGLGGLVDQRNQLVEGLSYLQFVTPGLLAANMMQASAPGSLWPVMAGTKWVRFFHGAVATPVSPGDVYGGYVVWITARMAVAAVAFVAVAALIGGVPSLWGVLAVPAATLTAMAFIAPLTAFAATQTTDISFGVLMRLIITPLFLFSGTFFPVSQLPGWLQPMARFSPLWHGVELCRAAMTGSADWLAVVAHVVVLGAIVAAGWLWGTRTFARKLAS
ncbi:MAG TPA: ABC transporter permease [Acidimicrobiales bacterium]|nr:ABC transporter permease [Acidimicrobiales bacterium]